MSLENLLKLSNNYSKSGEVIDAIERGVGLVQVEGLAAAAKSLMIADAFVRTGRTMFVLTYTHEQAERIAEDLPHYGIGREQVTPRPHDPTVKGFDRRSHSRSKLVRTAILAFTSC